MDQAMMPPSGEHSHFFLGAASAANERKTWVVVGLTSVMMLVEIIGGSIFHSIALVADGIHMSTHAGVMLLAALAYRYARKHAADRRFAMGTGKLGDLAAFTSAIILAMFSVLIGYEALSRFFAPERIDYAAAIPIAVLGLGVNAVSAWVLAGDHDHGHDHGHGHGHGHGHDHGHHDHGHHHHGHDHDAEPVVVASAAGRIGVEIFEAGVPPRFRLRGIVPGVQVAVETVRGDLVQSFALVERADFWESVEEIPEPHAFLLRLRLTGTAGHDETGLDEVHELEFAEPSAPEPGATNAAVHRDFNMRAAYVHVLADSAVSGLVIVGLLMAKFLGWVWMDPVMGLVGALVVANWAVGLVRAAGAILLDMTPGADIPEQIRSTLERDGDRVSDLHVWRVGPGHLAAIIALRTSAPATPAAYRRKLSAVSGLSHVTVEVEPI